MWEGGRYPQTECVPAGGVARGSVATHQRWLRLLYLHCTFVKLCRLLKITLLIAVEEKAVKDKKVAIQLL